MAIAVALTLAAGAVRAQTDTAGTLERVEQRLQSAQNLGARRDLPGSYRALEKRLEDARRDGIDAEALVQLELDARQLANRAAFVNGLRDSRSVVEAMANRFDRALEEIAVLENVDLDRGLSGVEAADHLMSLIEAARRQRQTELDSLRLRVASLQELTGGHAAAQDSLITSLQVEVSDLRRRLWQSELRAGVAEADRSAAESALTVRQDREKAVKEIRTDLGESSGNVLIMPEGEIVLQVHGLAFGVGSSQLKTGQNALLDKLAAAIKRFPGAAVRVEGHTDDTGTRSSNIDLSQKRAQVVARALAQRLAVDPATIPTLGHGPDKPIAPNSSDAGRARNRRIDVVIVPVS